MNRHLTTFLGLAAIWLISTSGFAAKAPAAADRFRPLVDEFYLNQLTAKKSASALADPSCPPVPDHQACVTAACGKLRGYECDEPSEIAEVSRACQGNYGAACLNYVCGKIRGYECDDRSEVVEIAAACRGNVDASCIDLTCSRVASYYCDERSELTALARQCAGNGP